MSLDVVVGARASAATARGDPEIANDTAGNAYFVWLGHHNRTVMSVSQDDGPHWADPVHVNPPHVLSSTLASPVAGSPGRVAVFYLGNDHSNATPAQVAPDSKWHAYVSFSLNALDPNPTWVTVQLDTDGDPVQVGGIRSLFGPNPPNTPRNLLDFADLVLGPDGRVVAAYADGETGGGECEAVAANAAMGRDCEGVAAVQLSGPSLRE